MYMKKLIIIGCCLFLSCGTNDSDATEEDIRDPWLWPFSSTSIWNMPVGDEAIYEPANFEEASNVGIDIQHLLVISENDPNRQVLNSPTWGPGRCSGETDLGFTLQIPDDWIVPDAGNSPYGLTPNSNFAFLLPDGETLFQSTQISRCEEAGPVYLPEWMKYEDNRNYVSIYSDGLDGGGQGASGMSALGGTIRLGEFTSEEPIQHVLKINPWAEKYVHYSEEYPGWKWPAKSADNYAEQGYNRNADPNILMGSLFAIPPELTPEAIEISTEPGQKLFFTLQNYGMYFTEDAAWDTWDIIVERGVEVEFQQAFGFSMESEIWLAEVNKLMGALHVITNNGPSSIGGGGNPFRPLAPEF